MLQNVTNCAIGQTVCEGTTAAYCRACIDSQEEAALRELFCFPHSRRPHGYALPYISRAAISRESARVDLMGVTL
jgi:hypothetical protein